MARVLWLGDAGCSTGFATVTHAIGDRLVTQYGHDVHVLAVNYKGDYVETSMKLYVPTIKDTKDTRGASRILEMIDKVRPEIVISLNDPWVLAKLLFKNRYDQSFALARYAPILAYMPIDGENYPLVTTTIADLVKKLPALEGAQTAHPLLMPVVMSKFGNTTYPQAPLVYHGIDTDYFQPASVRQITLEDGTVVKSKRDARRTLGLPPDCILAVRVDRNSARKNYADTVKALAQVMRVEPKLHAWLHCQDDDPAGVDLNLLVSRFPDVQDRFHWPGGFDTISGWDREMLRLVYTAGDFFVSTSGGEGFGLTLGEALSMGLPVIALNVSAITEVVGPGGILLDPAGVYTPLSGQDNWLPDIPAFSTAIHRLVNSSGARKTLGAQGRAHVVANFSWDEAALGFDSLITATIQNASGALVAGGTA